ncbi:unnamed protein product [Lymnaea stagnalis]|uniref:Heparan-sulfate 6-O-sulfotransferase n=1 Tax=Lymnaea stagnalis TaxID=6523 RepID=A0AAV2HUU1_LYMST
MKVGHFSDKILKVPRALAIQLLVFLGVVMYLYSRTPTVLVYELREKAGHGVKIEHAFWRRLGVETECTQFIIPGRGGVLLDDVQAYRSNLLITRTFSKEDLEVQPVELNINQSDVIVVQHIQKTGGTALENRLVQNTNIKPPCVCKNITQDKKRTVCSCLNAKGQVWTINRHATGWACGVHADFTELTDCVDHWFRSQPNENRKRRYHYVTVVRDPVTRFVSEWLHVRRGATWKECRLHCDGRDASLAEVPYCFNHGTWANVTFDEFLSCPSNMAFNRQTRMLANLSLSDCYRLESNKTRQERDEIMLKSAEDNLRRFFKFFFLVEYQEEAQELLERTFTGLKLNSPMIGKKFSSATSYAMLSEKHWEMILEKNLLDVRLYQFAKDLFMQRLRRLNIEARPRTNEAIIVQEGFTYATVTV